MADDHTYHHQVEVDDFEEDDSASSSDMDASEPAQELMEEIDTRTAQHAPSPRPAAKQNGEHRSKGPKVKGSHEVQSTPSARRPRNLEVEVAGPTEDVRSGFPASCLAGDV